MQLYVEDSGVGEKMGLVGITRTAWVENEILRINWLPWMEKYKSIKIRRKGA